MIQDWFDAIEKAALEIEQEKESRTPYEITLWFGLDGVRLKADGTIDEISRRKKETVAPVHVNNENLKNNLVAEPSQIYLLQQQNFQLQYALFQQHQQNLFQIYCHPQNYYNGLRYSPYQNNICTQTVQESQNMNIISSLNSQSSPCYAPIYFTCGGPYK